MFAPTGKRKPRRKVAGGLKVEPQELVVWAQGEETH